MIAITTAMAAAIAPAESQNGVSEAVSTHGVVAVEPLGTPMPTRMCCKRGSASYQPPTVRWCQNG